MKIELEIDDITVTAIALNNAVAAFGVMCWTAEMNCQLPGALENLQLLCDDEIKSRFRIVKNLYEQIHAIEKEMIKGE